MAATAASTGAGAAAAGAAATAGADVGQEQGEQQRQQGQVQGNVQRRGSSSKQCNRCGSGVGKTYATEAEARLQVMLHDGVLGCHTQRGCRCASAAAARKGSRTKPVRRPRWLAHPCGRRPGSETCASVAPEGAEGAPASARAACMEAAGGEALQGRNGRGDSGVSNSDGGSGRTCGCVRAFV